jgi:hypothetical protein
MTNVERLRAAVDKGDVTAFLGLADALDEEGHPDAPELSRLAVEIMTADDWAVVILAATVFLAILERSNP